MLSNSGVYAEENHANPKPPKITSTQEPPTITSMQYQPHMWNVKQDDVEFAEHVVRKGLAYTEECLRIHDVALGRTTYKNRMWAETMESDIRQMKASLVQLHKCQIDNGTIFLPTFRYPWEKEEPK